MEKTRFTKVLQKPSNISSPEIWTGTLLDFYQATQQDVRFDHLYFLILNEGNEMEIIVEGDKHDLTKDDIVFLTPYYVKSFRIKSSVVCGRVFGFSKKFYTVSSVYSKFFLEILATLNSCVFKSESATIKEISFIEKTFLHIYEMMEELSFAQNYMNERIVRTLISTMFLHIQKRKHRSKPEKELNFTISSNSLVSRFLDLLSTYIKKESTISFYIQKLNTTENILKSNCKKALGYSPKEIMQQRIIVEAKNLLSSDEMSIKEISYDLGYSDPTNFNKFFLKRTGMTPLQFRMDYKY